jgi:hypothetical protein
MSPFVLSGPGPDGRQYRDCDQKCRGAGAPKEPGVQLHLLQSCPYRGGRRRAGSIIHFIVFFDCGATVPQGDRSQRVEWPLARAA